MKVDRIFLLGNEKLVYCYRNYGYFYLFFFHIQMNHVRIMYLSVNEQIIYGNNRIIELSFTDFLV